LLLVYINRGAFIFSAYERENPEGEVNSVLEWVIQLVTGEENGIDEDGDVQTDCNCVQIVQYDFSQQLAQILELENLFSTNIKKTAFPTKENIPAKSFYGQIDHPPKIV
jgi:hypothetical protein